MQHLRTPPGRNIPPHTPHLPRPQLRTFEVTLLNATHFAEHEVALGFPPAGRQGEGAWNGVRHHHMDAHQLGEGEWVAVMDGDRYVSDYLTFKWVGRGGLKDP